MSNNRKRKFCELEHVDDDRASKRRKKDNENKIKSMFSDEDDHNQFMKLFESIGETAIAKQLNLSNDIIKEVAEHATGDWETCGDPDCGELVSVLEGQQTYWCPGCMKNVKYYECELHDQLLLPIIEDEDDYYCHLCRDWSAVNTLIACCGGDECGVCGTKYCETCIYRGEFGKNYLENAGECTKCGDWTCSDCVVEVNQNALTWGVMLVICTKCHKGV